MNKLYSIFAFAALMLVSLAANAWSYDLPSENDVLQNETYHMRLYKAWDFISLTVNGKEITPATFTTGAADETGMPVCDGYVPVKVTNEGMEGWYMGIGNIEFNPDKGGLYNNKNGIRYAVLSGLKEGQILCIQDGKASEFILEPNDVQCHNYVVNCNRIQKASLDGTIPAWTASYLENNNSYNVVEEITDDIHAAQDAAAGEQPEPAEGEEAPATHDNFRYFKVIADGPLYIAFGKTASIQGVQIWIDASAEESVSAPSYKMVSVNGTSRNIELTVGESTFGSDCTTSYGILDEGEDATYEDYEYDPSAGWFSVSSSDDDDGDGIVKIIAATTSATGAVSEVVTFDVSVGEITLNEPTLSLVGFDDETRLYTINWNNNTLCGEAYSISWEADNGEGYGEDVAIDAIIPCKNEVKVTIKAAGYNDGVATVAADYPGVKFYRVNADVEHDWDFVHPSDEAKNLIMGNVIEKVYVEDEETGEKTYYTVEEYEAGVTADGVDLTGDNVKKVVKESGWSWDGASNHMRAPWNVVADSVFTTNEEGAIDTTVVYKYAEDKANLLGQGVTLTCGPSSAGVSQVMTYLGNFNLGISCMSTPTLTFDRSILKPGQPVVVTIAAGGGSNYLTYDVDGTTPLVQKYVYICPSDDVLSFSLPRPASNFCHILYIDLYTQDNLPEDTYDPVGVSGVSSVAAVPVAYFTLSGAKANAAQKGINLVKYSDGSVKKVLVK